MNVLEQTAPPISSGSQEHSESQVVRCAPDQPIAIYQVHLPSWMRVPEEQNRPLTLPEITPKLAAHAARLNFTHVQLHSPGKLDPKELEFFASHLHQSGLGVIVETAPAYKNSPAIADQNFAADGLCTNGQVLMSDHTYAWDTAWAKETIAYFSTDPLYRKFRHAQLTHRNAYAFDNHYILPLSDQLVTRPRPSLWSAMPNDAWQKAANLRLLLAYTYLLPGKKMIFMGDEFGQENPWQPEGSLDWHLADESNLHGKCMSWMANLNRFYRAERALHETDTVGSGFQWMDTSDAASSVISFLRKSADASEVLLVILNFTPVPRHNYRVGVPKGGFWAEALNGDAVEFGGSGQGNLGGMEAAPLGWNFQSHSLMLTLPPLAAVVLKAPSVTP